MTNPDTLFIYSSNTKYAYEVVEDYHGGMYEIWNGRTVTFLNLGVEKTVDEYLGDKQSYTVFRYSTLVALRISGRIEVKRIYTRSEDE